MDIANPSATPPQPRELPRWRSNDERAFEPRRRPLPPDVVAEFRARRDKSLPAHDAGDIARAFKDSPIKHRVVLVGTVLAVIASVGFAGFFAGRGTAPAVERVQNVESPVWDAGSLAKLDKALEDLREGDATGAVTTLSAIRDEHGHLPALSYALALATMQAGGNAATLLENCVATGSRTSDALALQAVLGLGNKRTLLEQAIAADPMNPFPFVELAHLSRSGLETTKAIALLDSAQRRFLPVDSWVAVGVTKELVRLAALPDEELPAIHPDALKPSVAFASAYVALRKGEHTTAVALLSRMREVLEPATFVYLTSDQAFRAYRSEPLMGGLLR